MRSLWFHYVQPRNCTVSSHWPRPCGPDYGPQVAQVGILLVQRHLQVWVLGVRALLAGRLSEAALVVPLRPVDKGQGGQNKDQGGGGGGDASYCSG